MRVRQLLVVVTALLTAFAPAPFPKRTSDEGRGRLDGAWLVRTIRWQGLRCESISLDEGFTVSKNDRLVFSHGRAAFTAPDDPDVGARVWSFRLSGAGEVRSIDLFWSGPLGRRRLQGIYVSHGDGLTLSVGP